MLWQSFLSHFSFLLIYTLHLAKSKSEVRKNIVETVLLNSCSAVPNMIIKLVICNDMSILAFIFIFDLVSIICRYGFKIPNK